MVVCPFALFLLVIVLSVLSQSLVFCGSRVAQSLVLCGVRVTQSLVFCGSRVASKDWVTRTPQRTKD
jgi:hypothetical protein